MAPRRGGCFLSEIARRRGGVTITGQDVHGAEAWWLFLVKNGTAPKRHPGLQNLKLSSKNTKNDDTKSALSMWELQVAARPPGRPAVRKLLATTQ